MMSVGSSSGAIGNPQTPDQGKGIHQTLTEQRCRWNGAFPLSTIAEPAEWYPRPHSLWARVSY